MPSQAIGSRASSQAPTNEIGTILQGSFSPQSMAPWTSFVDQVEWVPELTWPTSVETYNKMRSDSQLSALYAGTVLPIRHWKWSIDPNGAEDAMVEKISRDLNLPIQGEDPKPLGRQKRRFSFDQHVRKAMYAGIYGHYFFEQTGEIGDDGLWHLRKLAERPPKTIQEIKVATDGGLVSIKQNINSKAFSGTLDMPEIPVDRLVAYVWEQEGGDWVGRSWFRDVYKNWLIKDRLVRVDAINHERSGGVPYTVAPPGATPTEIDRMHEMARDFKIGETSGGALPYGAELHIARAAGTDVIASVRYHDEAMARKFLLMVMQLGQTQTGSRALGATFVDFFSQGLETVGIWFRDLFNEHVIEDDIDWNYGEDVDFTPLLTFEHDPEIDVQSLATLVDKGAIVVDKDLEEELRKELGLPRKMAGARDPGEPEPLPPEPAGTPTQAKPAPVAGSRRDERDVAGGGVPSLPLPSRPLRRLPYEHEIKAATDFSSLDTAWESELVRLLSEWLQVRSEQAQELHDAIISAGGSLKKLARIEASPGGASVIFSRMQNIASQGASEAFKEASLQGMEHPVMPDLEKLVEELRVRSQALESLLASSLSESARTKAVQLSGGGLAPEDVAAEVKLHLNGLSNSWLRDQLGGALTAAQNAGRRATMAANNAVRMYASEILDHNTCERCITVDGREYQDPLLAARDYPTGGYKDCLGGPRCRGTLVAIYGAEEV